MKKISASFLVSLLSGPAFAATLSLMDERTSQSVPGYERVVDGGLIALKGLEAKLLNLRLDPENEAVKSVRFTWDGSSSRVENEAPYTVHKEDGTATRHFTLGTHTVSATLYSKSKGTGKVLGQFSFRIEVVESAEPDATAPKILSASVEGSTLSVQLDEKAMVSVAYGLTDGDLSQNALSKELRTDHVISFSALKEKTRYFYRFEASDRSGNSVVSQTSSFISPEKPAFVFPGSSWEKVAPESVGMKAASIADGVKYLRGKGPSDQVVVVRYGKLVHAGSKSKSTSPIWSGTKSFTSTVLGVLIQQGKVSLDDKAAKHAGFLTARYPNVTFRHLASMTSGYDAVGGSYGNGGDDGSSTPQNPASPLFAPGTSSAYWDDAMNAFGIALGQAAGTVIANVFNAQVGAKIGMKKVGWPTRGSYGGRTHSTGAGSGRGVTVTPEDMARLGLLMLRMGNWNGEQVLSAEWVRQATRTVQVPSSKIPNHPRSNNKVSGRYGFNWWVNGEGKLFSSLPTQAFGAFGAMGNFMVVVPDWDLIVVRLGTKSGGDEEEFIKRIMVGAQK